MSVMSSYSPVELPPISALLKEVEAHDKLNSRPVTPSFVPATQTMALNNRRATVPTPTPSVLLPSMSDTMVSSIITEQQRLQLQYHYQHVPNVSRTTDYTFGESKAVSRSASLTSLSSLNTIHHDHSPKEQSPVQALQYISRSELNSFPVPKDESLSLGEQSSPEQQDQVVNQILKEAKTPRRYKCKTCEKYFTTSGHLARHSRIHTGERKHICPFPECNARFARHDNCMQHYRTHKNPKTRKRRVPKN